MSASTVSITANPAAASRRRPVVARDKTPILDFPPSESLANGAVGETAGTSRDLVRAEAVLERSSIDLAPVVKKAGSAATGTNATATQRRTRKVAAAKLEKPRWKRVVSILTKNLVALLILVGMIQGLRKVVMKSEYLAPPSAIETEMVFSELEGRIAEVDGFLKTTTKMMQVQVELLDKKIDSEAKSLKQKIDETASALHTELKNLESRNDRLEKSVDELNAQNWVSRDELENIYEELKKGKEDQSSVSEINIDELRAYARNIVEKEIEKHAADGLGRVDYALASGGAHVVKHSEPYLVGKGGSWFTMNSRTQVHSNAVKLLSPSFGEPGQCFPLKGSNGYIQVRLRAPIIPEAITLEHVAKSVAFDRSSAPKDCRVSGWLQDQETESPVESENTMFLLTEFTYDLDKTNAQTFDVVDSARSALVDTVRLDFTSNHGSSHHTCIYRFRVHGREPKQVSVVPTQG